MTYVAFPIKKLKLVNNQIFCFARTEVYRLDSEFNYQIFYDKLKILEHAIIYQVELHGKTYLQNQIVDYEFSSDGSTMLVLLATKILAVVSMESYQVTNRLQIHNDFSCQFFMIPNFSQIRLPIILATGNSKLACIDVQNQRKQQIDNQALQYLGIVSSDIETNRISILSQDCDGTLSLLNIIIS